MSYFYSHRCAKCGGDDDVSKSWKSWWFCKACFDGAHRDAKKELNSITNKSYCDPILYHYAHLQYTKEFEAVLFRTPPHQPAMLQAMKQFVANVACKYSCDEATTQYAQAIFMHRMKDAIKECEYICNQGVRVHTS